ncbi:hypothetical protein VSH64_42200 [Amycolatopsis rhabdoformis]|uniref:LPXTG cell wall anchor domain-containing protein n=1 Tax=Amycolatopsis rhabdoformis TaxID=1448059 RepID=A0ABZ1I6T9_9PSEU|nr:hypothetical protein [Amycolatopsis rhabdoformis]WSE29350.1 hypothetical protein VSH64_42200 [Amycolatopsis rhabdoformis]
MKLSSSVITFGKLEAVGTEQPLETATVYQTLADVNKDAKPGTYTVTFLCGKLKVSQGFKVLPAKDAATPTKPQPTQPKQVSKVPVGAPQTGGTDGPVDDSAGTFAVAGGAMGVLALGGAGMVLARRRRG